MIRRIAVVALGALVFAGCGGGDDETQAPAEHTAAPKSVNAAMIDFEFVPPEISVAAGGRVTWTDMDSANHNVKFTTDGAPKGIDNLQQHQAASVTFPKPGQYAFVCTYHPNMQGTVTVE